MKEEIENWDDDDLDLEGDEFTFRSASFSTTAASHRRDSISSRISYRSEIDSNQGDEERQVHVPGNDEKSTIDAIAIAQRAGVPIPYNVPASALVGGTIKRLGEKKIKKLNKDDWDDGDLEIPGEGRLTLRKNHGKFPEAIRQVSGHNFAYLPSSSPQLQPSPTFDTSPRTKLKLESTYGKLNLHKEREERVIETEPKIRVLKSRKIPKHLPFITPPTPHLPQSQKGVQEVRVEDFEHDFQFPSGNEPLKLSVRREVPKTPTNFLDESDEWGEGSSLGTRQGGKRDRASNRSSSVTAVSPSVSSSLTIESGDDSLAGILVPNEPINFEDILKRRRQNQPLNDLSLTSEPNNSHNSPNDDFLSGLEIGFGNVFDSKKLTLNRNVKVRKAHQTSPSRPKAAVTLTFTNKASSLPNTSRLPRPHGCHDRVPSSLEPVSESGGPVNNRNRRSQSRLSGHSTQNSLNSITNTSTTLTNGVATASTPRQREIVSKSSAAALRKDPSTNAQVLKLKRSMPTIRSFHPGIKSGTSSRYERHPESNRPSSSSRPKTPIERTRSEFSQAQNKIHHVPFLPAGASNSQSHHVVAKNSRVFRRNDSESSTSNLERHPSSRAVSRATIRSPSPRRKASDFLAREATSKRLLTKPVRPKHFGDGGELDAFDDLPTSRDSEQRFVKEPVGRGPPKLSCSRKKNDRDILQSKTSAVPVTRKSRDELPRFARDTNVSRMARENTLAQRTSSVQEAPLATLTNQWKAKIAANTGLSGVKTQTTKSKRRKGPSQKPQLIKPLGNLNNPKSIKGMYYNPSTYRWEGNDSDLSPFNSPCSSLNAAAPPPDPKESRRSYRENETFTPRPALIQNVKSTQNVQVVGGMIFDPQRMCWLKMPSQRNRNFGSSDDGTNSLGFDDEEEDVFKDVPDLEDSRSRDCTSDILNEDGLKDDFIVGEEFDVGPEFLRRQREEEERWKRKVLMWIQDGLDIDRGNANWRWIIRDIATNHEF
ncbi:hypothetical protein K3495_g3617 [Podosphaera aphanis]|nr:hypothetical protein K3495_g3617 [Podosphaera aphanis]